MRGCPHALAVGCCGVPPLTPTGQAIRDLGCPSPHLHFDNICFQGLHEGGHLATLSLWNVTGIQRSIDVPHKRRPIAFTDLHPCMRHLHVSPGVVQGTPLHSHRENRPGVVFRACRRPLLDGPRNVSVANPTASAATSPRRLHRSRHSSETFIECFLAHCSGSLRLQDGCMTRSDPAPPVVSPSNSTLLRQLYRES